MRPPLRGKERKRHTLCTASSPQVGSSSHTTYTRYIWCDVSAFRCAATTLLTGRLAVRVGCWNTDGGASPSCVACVPSCNASCRESSAKVLIGDFNLGEGGIEFIQDRVVSRSRFSTTCRGYTAGYNSALFWAFPDN